MTSATIAAIIPARYASTRFPGKPLVKLGGLTMIERVYRQAARSSLVQSVIVATDDERIAATVEAFGGTFAITRADHASGTDRLAEVARNHPELDIIVNVQGDEPLIDPAAIDAAVAPLLSDPAIEMSTLAAPLLRQEEAESPQVVKVVVDRQGFALYFSRAAIPFYRDNRPFEVRRYLGHVGLYVYRRECLLKLASLTPTPLEAAESLEQLRALENGIRIRVMETSYRSLAIDVPEDVEAVEAALAAHRLREL
ncbi:MAG TPA: 3-deoxy-manno-octulosonate cytidylyltransferase [Candidatus Obscuribacterales bacterium]